MKYGSELNPYKRVSRDSDRTERQLDGSDERMEKIEILKRLFPPPKPFEEQCPYLPIKPAKRNHED